MASKNTKRKLTESLLTKTLKQIIKDAEVECAKEACGSPEWWSADGQIEACKMIAKVFSLKL